MALLSSVFGMTNEVPVHTYVDRGGLDAKFAYYLQARRHIVIYGSSQQGKSTLRKKCLPVAQCVTVQCTAQSTVSQIYQDVLAELGASLPKGVSYTATSSQSVKAGVNLGGSGAESELGGTDQHHIEFAIASDPSLLAFLATTVKARAKRIVVEDFHYLPDAERKRLAYDLKALWDQGVFVVIAGVWNHNNLLTMYNGELTGRVENVDLQWTAQDLHAVLDKGAAALGFRFTPDATAALVADAHGNVGLLQQLAEQFCIASGIAESIKADIPPQHGSTEAIAAARSKICADREQRYMDFARRFRQGVSTGKFQRSEKKTYEQILRIAVEARPEELVGGISLDDLVARTEPKVIKQNLAQSLKRIAKLQGDIGIDPPLLSYNATGETLKLVDPAFVVFNKYNRTPWPWDSEDETTEPAPRVAGDATG